MPSAGIQQQPGNVQESTQRSIQESIQKSIQESIDNGKVAMFLSETEAELRKERRTVCSSSHHM